MAGGNHTTKSVNTRKRGGWNFEGLLRSLSGMSFFLEGTDESLPGSTMLSPLVRFARELCTLLHPPLVLAFGGPIMGHGFYWADKLGFQRNEAGRPNTREKGK